MGLLDFLSGTKRPAAGITPASRADLETAILAINRPTAPFQVAKDETGQADLVAEWRIVDAKWYEIFARAGLKKVFRIKMRFDPEKHEVRALDEEYAVEWRSGISELSLAASGFRGQKSEVSFGTAYAFTEEFKPGQVYKYRFVTGEIKKPLQEAVLASGWGWRGVAFGKL